MSRRKNNDLREVPQPLLDKVRAPVGIILGSVTEVSHLVETLNLPGITCYQMDLYPAGRLGEALGERVKVEPSADLWDLPADFQTLIYLPAQGGERELKIDMVEQAFHILRPHGVLIVWSPYEDDDLFPNQLKKVFGRTRSYPTDSGTVLTCHRD